MSGHVDHLKRAKFHAEECEKSIRKAADAIGCDIDEPLESGLIPPAPDDDNRVSGSRRADGAIDSRSCQSTVTSWRRLPTLGPVETAMNKYVSQTDFHTLARLSDAANVGVEHLGSVAAANSDSRIVTFCFSDGSVDRMNDRIDPYGWDLTSFRSNPVALWAHDSSSPPIGRVRRTYVASGRLMGDIEFASAEIYPFADQVYKLVTNRFINSVSVGFRPITWQFSDDADRGFGIDFHEQELLEISVVPVPANANALVQAAVKSLAVRGAALAERPTPALSTLSFAGTARQRRFDLVQYLKRRI
jgi:HK97 family phage prohead protease